MEKHGIGTDASMSVHINNIVERGYVCIEKNRTLIPTKLGLSLVYGYRDIDKELVAPELRSGIEESVNLIAKGKKKHLQVISEVLEMFKKKYMIFSKNIEKIEKYFSGSTVLPIMGLIKDKMRGRDKSDTSIETSPLLQDESIILLPYL